MGNDAHYPRSVIIGCLLGGPTTCAEGYAAAKTDAAVETVANAGLTASVPRVLLPKLQLSFAELCRTLSPSMEY